MKTALLHEYIFYGFNMYAANSMVRRGNLCKDLFSSNGNRTHNRRLQSHAMLQRRYSIYELLRL